MPSQNPEIDQPRLPQMAALFQRSGRLIYQEQRQIYNNLLRTLPPGSVLEAGAGNGGGLACIERGRNFCTSTDKLADNCQLMSELYPWLHIQQWDITSGPYYPHDHVICIDVIEHIDDVQSAVNNLVLSASESVWISTPNKNNPALDRDVPANTCHVREYRPGEVMDLLGGDVTIRHWSDFSELPIDTEITPLVYERSI